MHDLDFGKAIELIKLGKKVARKGWLKNDMFIYLVPEASYPVQTGAAKSYFGEGSMIDYGAYMAIKTPTEKVCIYVPNTSDVLAEDWMLVE